MDCVSVRSAVVAHMYEHSCCVVDELGDELSKQFNVIIVDPSNQDEIDAAARDMSTTVGSLRCNMVVEVKEALPVLIGLDEDTKKSYTNALMLSVTIPLTTRL